MYVVLVDTYIYLLVAIVYIKLASLPLGHREEKKTQGKMGFKCLNADSPE